MIVQFCGLSGSGKTTLALAVGEKLTDANIENTIIDGDEYRKTLCKDLGFSRADRYENIRRLSRIAGKMSEAGAVAIISAINPYAEIREEIMRSYPEVKLIYIRCPLAELIRRDTKNLYRKALLDPRDPERIGNLSGVNDPFEVPEHPDLILDTNILSVADASERLLAFIKQNLKPLI